MDDLSAKIETARKAGYSDDDIANFLSNQGDLGPKIKTAKDAGYTSTDIVNHLSQSSQPATQEPSLLDRGVNALKRGADTVLEGIGTTAEQLGANGVGQTLKDAIATPDTPSATEKFVNKGKPGFDTSALPEAIVEQVPQYAGSLAARGTGAAIGGAVAGPPGAAVGALAGPGVLDFAQTFGPNALAHAKNNGRDAPNWEDWTAAAGTSAASGVLASLGLAGPSGAVKRAALDTAANYLGNIVQQQGTGSQISNKEALGNALVSAPAALGTQAAVNTAVKAGKAVTKVTQGEPVPENIQTARTSLANRLKEAQASGADLRDTTRNKFDNQTRTELDNIHTQVSEEIKSYQNVLRPLLNSVDTSNFDSILDNATANAGLRGAKNKLKNTVNDAQRATIEKMVGHYAEGQELLKRLDESNELTRLYKKGMKGGVSQYTDNLNPFSRDPRNILNTAMAAAAANAHLPGVGILAAPAGQLGIVGAGRLVDAATGRRYPVERFMKQNLGPQAEASTAPSFMAQRAMDKLQGQQGKDDLRRSAMQAQQDRSDANRALYQKFRAGTLTADDIEANAKNLSDSQYKLFYDNIDKSKAKAEKDALAADRAVVRQGEIMGKQRQAEEKQNLTDLTTGMKMTARGRAQASAQEQRAQQAADFMAYRATRDQERSDARQAKAEAAQRKAEAKDELNATLKEGTDLANSGGLTEGWLTSNRDRLSPSQYASFAGKLARQKAQAEKAAAKAKETPAVGKAPRAPRAPKVAAPAAAPAEAAPQPAARSPLIEQAPPQTHIEYPDAYNRKLADASIFRKEIEDTADLVRSDQHPGLREALLGAVEALDSMPRNKRNNHKKRVKLTNRIRDSLHSAEDQMLFDDTIRHFRDLFKGNKPQEKDVLKKVRKAQGLSDLPDVPF